MVFSFDRKLVAATLKWSFLPAATPENNYLTSVHGLFSQEKPIEMTLSLVKTNVQNQNSKKHPAEYCRMLFDYLAICPRILGFFNL